MTPIELRAKLEDAGGSLLILNGHLRVFARPSVLEQLRDELHRHRAALVELVKRYPCRGCGRDPSAAPLKCGRCAALTAAPIAAARRPSGEQR